MKRTNPDTAGQRLSVRFCRGTAEVAGHPPRRRRGVLLRRATLIRFGSFSGDRATRVIRTVSSKAVSSPSPRQIKVEDVVSRASAAEL